MIRSLILISMLLSQSSFALAPGVHFSERGIEASEEGDRLLGTTLYATGITLHPIDFVLLPFKVTAELLSGPFDDEVILAAGYQAGAFLANEDVLENLDELNELIGFLAENDPSANDMNAHDFALTKAFEIREIVGSR